MLGNHRTAISRTYNTEALEDALEAACGGNIQITHGLELSRLATLLCYEAEVQKQGGANQNDIEPLKALTNFRANLRRRKKASDILTSSRLMDIPEPARAILLSDIAFVFRNDIDDYTQIDFGNDKHVELLSIAVDNSISKISNRQGRPVNEPLDEFFVGLRDLYEAATGKEAIAEAHFNNEPKTDFEKVMYLGYQIIRPAQEYQAALKAYQRAISRKS